jgi:hypothetical protein
MEWSNNLSEKNSRHGRKSDPGLSAEKSACFCAERSKKMVKEPEYP